MWVRSSKWFQRHRHLVGVCICERFDFSKRYSNVLNGLLLYLQGEPVIELDRHHRQLFSSAISQTIRFRQNVEWSDTLPVIRSYPNGSFNFGRPKKRNGSNFIFAERLFPTAAVTTVRADKFMMKWDQSLNRILFSLIVGRRFCRPWLVHIPKETMIARTSYGPATATYAAIGYKTTARPATCCYTFKSFCILVYDNYHSINSNKNYYEVNGIKGLGIMWEDVEMRNTTHEVLSDIRWILFPFKYIDRSIFLKSKSVIGDFWCRRNLRRRWKKVSVINNSHSSVALNNSTTVMSD